MTNSSKHPEFFYFRTEFDKTLKTYFKERIDLSVLPPNFSLNIPVLSCLILLVERENEIKDFPKSPPDRYTKDSFVDDIESVGIGVDRVVFDTIEELFTLGFIVEVDSEIKPSDTAYKIVDFINSIFPEMQGINFIAYIVQTIEEVYSDRKSLAEGKEVFYQTLKLRGKKKSSESAKAFQFFQTPLSEKKAVSSKALKERLSQLRKSRNSEEKAVFKKVQVKSVFGSFNKEEVQKEEVQKEEVQKEEVQKEEVQKEEIQKEEIQKEEIQKEEVQKEEVQKETALSEEEIAQRISVFQNELAMICPVCNEGKIVENETEKGKVFYECTNNLCHFISWAKPYHFTCPLCSNPFLIEEVSTNGSKGLKCQRATCDYRQEGLGNPGLFAKPKKKKRIVRRVRRKK